MNREQFLKSYTGNFPFLVELKAKYAKYGRLTHNQWHAVEKCQKTEERRAAASATKAVAAAAMPQTAIACNVPLILKRRGARIVKEDNSLPLYPFTVTVKGVVARTGKATLVDLTLTTGSVTVCRCCGKDLTDVRSQATGIGPVCAKRYHIPYPKDCSAPEIAKFKLDLENLAKSIGTIRTWIPSRTIKSGLVDLNRISTPVSQAVNNPGLAAANIAATLASTNPTPIPTPSNQGVSASPTESKFKVGDKVKWNGKIDYGITGPDMRLAEVVEVFPQTPSVKWPLESHLHDIKIRILDHHESSRIGNSWPVNSNSFDLVSDTKPVTPTIEFDPKDPNCKLRYNPKTKSFSGEISELKIVPGTEIMISSKTKRVVTFVAFKIKETDGEINYWQYRYTPGATNIVKEQMDLLIFND